MAHARLFSGPIVVGRHTVLTLRRGTQYFQCYKVNVIRVSLRAPSKQFMVALQFHAMCVVIQFFLDVIFLHRLVSLDTQAGVT